MPPKAKPKAGTKAKAAPGKASSKPKDEFCSKEEIVEVFKRWDENGDGVISPEELRAVLERLGAEEGMDIDAIFKAADLNKDGKVDYTEFVTWIFSGEGTSEAKDVIDQEKEAKEQWEKYAPEDGAMKLTQFANVINAMNVKKCQIWGEHCGPIVKDQWKEAGGAPGKTIDEAAFVVWYPKFLAFTQAAVDEIKNAEAKKAAEKAAAAQAKKDMYAGDGVWTVPLKELDNALDAALEKGKTPLIIDDDETHPVETYYAYGRGHLIEAKKMVVDKGSKKATLDEILEDVGKKFGGAKCFKNGQTAVLRMSNTAWDVEMFTGPKFAAKHLFDVALIEELKTSPEKFKTSPFAEMVAEADRAEVEMMGINKGFRVVAITHFKEEDYKGFLEKMLPLDKMQVIKPLMAS